MPFATRSRAAILSVALAAALPPLAPAQPVFFDDFNGPTLDPRWQFQPPPFNYTLAGGRLTVTRLNGLDKHAGYRFGSFGVDLPQLTDFRATVDLGWASGSQRMLYVMLDSFGSRTVSHMIMAEFLTTSPGVTFYGQGGPSGTVPIPPPGPHRFTLIRQSGQLRWELDDVQVGAAPDAFGDPLTRLTVLFVGPWEGNPAPMWLDSVIVVPTAPSAFILGAGAFLVMGTRRRTWRVDGRRCSARVSGAPPGAVRTSSPSTCATCARGRS